MHTQVVVCDLQGNGGNTLKKIAWQMHYGYQLVLSMKVEKQSYVLADYQRCYRF